MCIIYIIIYSYVALYGSISFEQITGKKSPCDNTIVCYTPFQSCKAEDFSSLFNVALSNFESVDVYLVFPDTSCHFDAQKKMWTWYQTWHDLWNPKCSFHQVWIHARAC